MANSRPQELVLLGRRGECEVLDRLVASARAGESQVLVVRGEAGVGKTALLEYLVERASGCRITRAVGVESEMELAFSGLHQLCAPLLDRMRHLPGPQRDAIETAFGVSAGEPPDRFLVSLAVLSLLAQVAEEGPLVCVVDDAQWLDRVSAQTLAFVARRLLAERVALVFGVREGTEHELGGLRQLAIGGLNDDDARALLDWAVPGPVDERVRDRLVAETRGNPLALLELPRGLSPAELAGGFGLLDSMPLAGHIEQGFVRRLQPLGADTRRLLLIAAVEPVGDVAVLWRAAERFGIGPGAADAAASAGLLEIGSRVRFRHPLVRSAAYRDAGAQDLQDVSRALAEVTDPDRDPDRRAWHLAHAATGPDEAVAAELERSAGRAQSRGGVAAAAAFLERATDLTPDAERRGTRALAAAQAKFDAAAHDSALELLAIAELCPLDELQRAQVERLRGMITFALVRDSEAAPLLEHAAVRLEPLDPALARETRLEALGAAVFAGRLEGGKVVPEIAAAARAAPPGPEPPRAIDLLLDGLAIRYTDGYPAAVRPLGRALDALLREEPGEEGLRWLWLASPVAYEVWDDEAVHQLTTRAVRFARDAGALRLLPTVLVLRAVLHVYAGELAAATSLIAEADAINEATGTGALVYTGLALAAWRGQEGPALELIDGRIRHATATGAGRAIIVAEQARAVLYNGLGRYDAAFAAARRACEHEDLGMYAWGLMELVEAAARSGNLDAAADAMRRLEERTRAGGTDWALGIEARSRALLTDGDAAEALYREALERLAGSRIAVHHARARLVYGEWLRRRGRRVDAREQLRAAHEALAGAGADAFAERAHRELLATGETVRKRSVETLDELTAQEAQIARLASEGRTNPEIGAELFISPRTVEWHLRKVFGKLGISSRRDLGLALPA